MSGRRRKSKIGEKPNMSFRDGVMALGKNTKMFKCPVPDCLSPVFRNKADLMSHIREMCENQETRKAAGEVPKSKVGNAPTTRRSGGMHSTYVFPVCEMCSMYFLTSKGLNNHNSNKHKEGNEGSKVGNSRYSFRSREQIPLTFAKLNKETLEGTNYKDDGEDVLDDDCHEEDIGGGWWGDNQEERCFPKKLRLSVGNEIPPSAYVSISKDHLCPESTNVPLSSSSFFERRSEASATTFGGVQGIPANMSSFPNMKSPGVDLLLSSGNSSSDSSSQSSHFPNPLPSGQGPCITCTNSDDSWDGDKDVNDELKMEGNHDPDANFRNHHNILHASLEGQEGYDGNAAGVQPFQELLEEQVPITDDHPCTSYAFEGTFHEDEYKDESLNDLFPHLAKVLNSTDGLKPLSGSRTIMDLVDEMHRYREQLKLTFGMMQGNLSYLRLLRVLTKPGLPESLYDDVAKILTCDWSLKNHCDNVSYTNNKRVPTRRTVMKWVAETVHGGTKSHHYPKSMPQQNNLALPSGKNVIITTNDFEYQLALLFADEALMIPDNFIFPNPSDPSELPDFETCGLGELNTGVFYKRTSESLSKYTEYESLVVNRNIASLQRGDTAAANSSDSDMSHRNMERDEYFPKHHGPLPPRVVMSFQLFIDGTLVARNSVEPISLCPGIFSRDIRNLARSWFIVGYIEPEINYVGTHNQGLCAGKSKQQVKLEDYHAIIEYILHDFSLLQEQGFLLKVPVCRKSSQKQASVANNVIRSSFGTGSTKRDSMVVHFLPVLQLVISDCKGANYLAGRYGGHTKVKCLVRDCDVLSSDGDLTTHCCRMFLQRKMREFVREEMNNRSFHKLGKNGFAHIILGWNARYGQYGLSPPEILHMYWLGLCEYLWEGFTDKITSKVADIMDRISTRIVLRLSRQIPKEAKFNHQESGESSWDTDSPFPDVSCFRNGIFQVKHIMYGKEKYSRIFLLYCCFLHSDFVEELSKSKKRSSRPDEDPFEWNKPLVKKWFKLLSWSLSLNSWFALEVHNLKNFVARPPHRRNPKGEPIALLAMRDYLKLYKELVQRKKGEGLKITKFHSMLHLPHYVLIHGSMRNFDGSRPESIGKTLVKDPGARTQHQVSTLTRQAAQKLKETRDIDHLASIVKYLNPHLFVTRNLQDNFVDHHALKRFQAKTHALSAIPSHQLTKRTYNKAMFNTTIADDDSEDEEENNQVDINSHPPRTMRNVSTATSHSCTYQDKGSRFRIIVQEQETKLYWTTKTEYEFVWNDDVIKFLQQSFQIRTPRRQDEVVNRRDNMILEGFTEVVVATRNANQNTEANQDQSSPITSGNIVTYRAHPNYRSKKNWHSWAMVEWDMSADDAGDDRDMEEYPARLIMFFSIQNHNQFNRLVHQSFEKSNSNKYAVIQSVNSETQLQRYTWPRLNGVLHINRAMEDKYRIVSMESLTGKTPVILADTFFESKRINFCTEIIHPSLWDSHFYSLSTTASHEIRLQEHEQERNETKSNN